MSLNAIWMMPWNWTASPTPVNATGDVWKRRIVPETTSSPFGSGTTLSGPRLRNSSSIADRIFADDFDN